MCEDNGVAYVFGDRHEALAAKVEDIADTIRVVRAYRRQGCVRGFAETHARGQGCGSNAASPPPPPLEATRWSRNRYVVTNIATGTPEWLTHVLYCARGQPRT